MSAFWAQMIAAVVGAVTTGLVRYLGTYLPNRTIKRTDGARPGKMVIEDAEAE